MSEEGGESRNVGAFLLGFLTGVLVCIGVGGGFFFVGGRRLAMQVNVARMEAEMARADAEAQRARAEAELRRAEAEARKANEAAKKPAEDKLPKPREVVDEEENKVPQPAKEKSK
jgi:hypothetical protein